MFAQTRFLLRSSRLAKINQFSGISSKPSYYFSNNPNNPNEDINNINHSSHRKAHQKATYDELVRANTSLKRALKCMVDAQHTVLNVPSYDPLRV